MYSKLLERENAVKPKLASKVIFLFYKIMDRPFKAKYGTVSQVCLQLRL